MLYAIDPVPGSSSEAFAAERQAVGRAVRQGMSKENPCNVVRFVGLCFFCILTHTLICHKKKLNCAFNILSVFDVFVYVGVCTDL